jgi:perosamine synthetase
MSETLALHGGLPVIRRPFPPYRSLGEEEIAAANRVLRGGVLSAYLGAAGEAFLGGAEVRALEEEAAAYFGVRYAIAVNSGTSGLIAAVGALGIEPGDEIIVTPWTMAASATAIVHWNAIPVFADIDPDTFTLDPAAVGKAVTPRTRAILSVDIFGQSADMDALRAVADRHDLKVISDSAQSPGARYRERYAGTLADIGLYSLNYHKHIHCGEGGIVVTDDERYAQRLRLIRNHAEAVVSSDHPAELANMIGFNFRLGEIESAITREQLRKLALKVASRQRAAAQLAAGLGGLPGLVVPRVRASCTHVYYVFGMKLEGERLAVKRDAIVAALRAEGVTGLGAGYQNIHRLPMFAHGIAYGSKGFPWSGLDSGGARRASTQDCPVAERLHQRDFFYLGVCAHEYHDAEVQLVVAAFRKVWDNLPSLGVR